MNVWPTKTTQPANTLSRQEFLKWYHVGSQGQALQALESSYLESKLKITYSKKTLQVGRLGSESRFINSDSIGDFTLADNKGPRSFPTFVQACAGALPFATESIDTFILPHVLEFVPDRHQVLREVERVLKPEGRLFILGLNPWSPYRLVKLPFRNSFWNARLIAGHHLLDWLSLLKFDAQLDAAFGGTPRATIYSPESAWTELKAGLSLGYAIKAVKRSYNIIPLEPDWSRLTQLVTGPLIETPPITQRQQP